MPTYDYDCKHCGVIEIIHGINEENKTVCPECNKNGLAKLISGGGAVIIAGREMNQYKEVQYAKYWRDKNGVRHRVKSGDGYTGSATITKQTATSDEVRSRKEKDRKAGNKARLKLQKDRADAWNRKHIK